MSIIVNAMFSRTVWKGRRPCRTETKTVTGIELERRWEGEQAGIRKDLCSLRPEGRGWMLAGYALVEEAQCP